MTIAFDAGSTGFAEYASSATWSHTVGSGSDRYLSVGIEETSTSDKVAGVTYNGVAMVRVRTEQSYSSKPTYVYGLVNPASGTHNIVVTFTSGGCEAACVASSWTGVDQTTPVYSHTGNSNNGTGPQALTVTTTTGAVTVDYMGSNLNEAFTQGSGQTLIGQLVNGSEVNAYLASSYKAATTSMSWSWVTFRIWSQSSVTLNPVAAADTTVPTMTGTVTSSGVTSSGFTIDWAGTTRSDNVAVTGYETSPDNSTWTDAGNVTNKAFTGLSSSTSYTKYVRRY